MKKRWFNVFLASCMALTLVPTAALATEEAEAAPEEVVAEAPEIAEAVEEVAETTADAAAEATVDETTAEAATLDAVTEEIVGETAPAAENEEIVAEAPEIAEELEELDEVEAAPPEETEDEAETLEAASDTLEPIEEADAPEESLRSIVASGYCGADGDNVAWELDSNGLLILSGRGAMKSLRDSSSTNSYYNYRGQIKTVRVESGVTTIGAHAFGMYASDYHREYYSNLTKVEIADTVTTIGTDAFYECTSLTEVTGGNGVTSIGWSAFYKCTSLPKVTIGNSVTSIENYAFDGCTGLTEATIGNGVTSIENYAFRGCTALKKVTVGNAVTTIGECAFQNCTKLASVTLGNAVQTIKQEAFYGCTALTDITIPESLTVVNPNAFYGCKNLMTVYYGGNESQWNDISIASNGNTYLIYVDDIRYNSGGNTANEIPKLLTAEVVDDSIVINWQGVQGVDKYRVYRKTTGTSWKKLKDVSGETYTDTALITGTKYIYTVRGIDESGKNFLTNYNKTGVSATYIAMLALDSATVVSSGITVKWVNLEGVKTYRVFRKTASGSWSKLKDVSTTSYTDTTAKTGTQYIYTVRGLSDDSKSYITKYDTTGVSATYIKFATPTLYGAYKHTNGIVLAWEPVDGLISYRIYRKTANGSWAKLKDVTNATSYLDKTAASGTTYYYTVRGISGGTLVTNYNTTGVSATR